MDFKLEGDYFDGSFHKAVKADETILKTCPGDLSLQLWEAQVDFAHTQQTVTSSIEGFSGWRKLSLSERANFLKKYQAEVDKRKDDLALSIALETGKPLWESKTEAAAIGAKVEVTISDSLGRIEDKHIPNILKDIDGHVIRKPLGPCLVIGPFNFPCHLANTQILAALLTGNSVIFKPSEKTIHSGQILMECFHAAGFPKGVVNLINGGAATTQEIIKHPAIKGIFFTGSLQVGKKILQAVGSDLTKLVALELGGKNTTIVHKDAKLEHTLAEALRSCYLTAGQRCTSTSTIVVHQSILEEFTEKFVALTKKIIVGHPTKSKREPFMGPLIDAQAVQSYQRYSELGKKGGAEALVDFEKLNLEYEGHYVSASVFALDKFDKDNPYTQEEIFAPHCTITSYQEIDEAIDIANITEYGLAASIFTNEKSLYQRCLRDIDSGIINLNRSTVGASAKLPFGGVKNSGNFRPAAVSMVDHTVHTVSSLETLDSSSKIESITGLD